MKKEKRAPDVHFIVTVPLPSSLTRKNMLNYVRMAIREGRMGLIFNTEEGDKVAKTLAEQHYSRFRVRAI